MKIELATRDDVAAILAISNAAAAEGIANLATAPEPLDEWLGAFDRDHESYPWLVARDAGSVLGFAKAAPFKTRGAYAWSTEVSVYVRAPRRGIGRALYERLLPLLRTQGFATVFAGISQPNEASVALHEAFGFRRCALFTRAGFKNGTWCDLGFWELHFSEAAPGARKTVAECWSSPP